jgi:hypothetical protein
MSRSTKRAMLFAILVIFLALQGWATFVAHGGGIAAHYSFKEGFTEYFRMSLADPLMTAGLIDFMTVALILGVFLIMDMAAVKRMGWRLVVFVIAFIIFPGLGLLLYLLWLHPDHPLMRDSGS